MKIGYARVSTQDQDLSLQIDDLQSAGCEKIFEDRTSGAKIKRNGLDKAVSHLRKDDVFVVWKLDRLGRSLKNLIDFVQDLNERGIEFQSITDKIDTTSPAGRFFFHMMGALAQMERELIAERTKAGLEAARKRGRVGGRPRAMTESKVKAAKKLLTDGIPRMPTRIDLCGPERFQMERILGIHPYLIGRGESRYMRKEHQDDNYDDPGPARFLLEIISHAHKLP